MTKILSTKSETMFKFQISTSNDLNISTLKLFRASNVVLSASPHVLPLFPHYAFLNKSCNPEGKHVGDRRATIHSPL